MRVWNQIPVLFFFKVALSAIPGQATGIKRKKKKKNPHKSQLAGGRITSTIVGESFSNGDPCDGPVIPLFGTPFCTEGKFLHGPLHGPFRFVAQSLDPTPAGCDPPSCQASIALGTLTLKPWKLCSGEIVFADQGGFSLGPDGLFGTMAYVQSATGDCIGKNIRYITSGVFQGGCVDCDYKVVKVD